MSEPGHLLAVVAVSRATAMREKRAVALARAARRLALLFSGSGEDGDRDLIWDACGEHSARWPDLVRRGRVTQAPHDRRSRCTSTLQEMPWLSVRPRPADLLVGLAATTALYGAAPATAYGAAVKCRIGYFAPGLDDGQFPTIHRLRAVNLPRRTDDYAPRCLVAESVAALIKDGVARAANRHGDDFRFNKHAPKRVTPMGARWHGGKYRVRYRVLACDCDPYVMVTATRGTKRIRFLIGSQRRR
jgi:hypothetical protein